MQLRAGVACASVSGVGWAATTACVEARPLGDGAWHTLRAERHGHNIVVSVDDGDAWRRNESLVSLGKDAAKGVSEQAKGEPPAPLVVDKHDGVTLGGLPEFMGVNLVSVHEDLQDSKCFFIYVLSGFPCYPFNFFQKLEKQEFAYANKPAVVRNTLPILRQPTHIKK